MNMTVEMIKQNEEVYEEIRKEILESVRSKASDLNSKIEDCQSKLTFIADNLFVLRQYYFEEGIAPKDRIFDNAFYFPELIIGEIKEALGELNCYEILT